MGGGLTNLYLHRFRSYRAHALDTQGASCIVLVGPNGAGKTNILEALSLFYPGRGLRRAHTAQLINSQLTPTSPEFSPQPTKEPLILPEENPRIAWSLSGSFQTPSGPLDISLSQPLEGRRQITCNGAKCRSATALLDHLVMAWCSPEMDNFCSPNQKLRKRLLDRLVLTVDPDHAQRCHTYTRSVAERSSVLESPFFKDRAAWLTSLEHLIATTYIDILKARLAYIQRYNQNPLDLGLPRCSLSLEGSIISLVDKDSQATTYALGVLYQHRKNPHRRLSMPSTHLQLYHPKGHDVGLCSTGEQKAVVVAVTLESLLKAQDPTKLSLLLLDDVTSYQDDRHRQALFSALSTLKAQVWLTGTDKSLFLGLPALYISLIPRTLTL